ncbi:MAG TPA: hypothetical protein VK604_03755 [Bryobacteraceae bacterium]|nr:hypothetical protein [Bryobacteraceae bacterium]
MNDVLNGLVSFVISGFQFAVWPMSGIGLEVAVGQLPAEALVEEQEQQRNLDAFSRPAVVLVVSM